MNTRTRSPSYPSTPIAQAIEYARKLHQIERTNPIDRTVAAKALGYSGLSGRSATVLSDLSQYGLVERAGKSELRVTPTAVELLHPDDQYSWGQYLQEAAQKPELFQRIAERFPDGRPSENALESFLVKQGFTYSAIPAAIRAYNETFSYLEEAIEYESTSPAASQVTESQPNQSFGGNENMKHIGQTPEAQAKLTPSNKKFAGGEVQSGATVSFAQKRIWLGGVITNQSEADELIETVMALRPMLNAALPSGKIEDAETEN